MRDLEKEVRKLLRKKMWLVLSTASEKGQPQSSVVVYQSDGQVIYIMTGENTIKVNNIKRNNKVSVTIPFRINFLHKLVPAPPAELHFKAKAEIIPFDDEEARRIFKKFLKHVSEEETTDKSVWIKIIPSNRIITYGVGIKLFEMRKPEKARNIVLLK